VSPEIVVHCDMNDLGRGAIGERDSLQADLAIESKQTSWDRLSEKNVCLQLPWMGTTDWRIAGRREKEGVDQLPDLERQS